MRDIRTSFLDPGTWRKMKDLTFPHSLNASVLVKIPLAGKGRAGRIAIRCRRLIIGPQL
jgi:hypothetical protein